MKEEQGGSEDKEKSTAPQSGVRKASLRRQCFELRSVGRSGVNYLGRII